MATELPPSEIRERQNPKPRDMTQIQENSDPRIVATDSVFGILPVKDRSPITVIGTEAIRDGFDAMCLQQALNSRAAPGVTELVLNPDAMRLRRADRLRAGFADAHLSRPRGRGYQMLDEPLAAGSAGGCGGR